MDRAQLPDNFFAVIRAGLNIPGASPVGEIDGAKVLKLAQKQSVLPIVRDGLRALGVTGEVMDEAERLCVSEMKQFVRRDMAFEAVCRCLEENSVDYIPLKGAVLRDLYPDKWLRTSCDIDILVRERDLSRAAGLIEKNTEFVFEKTNGHDITFKAPRVTLELHFNLKEQMDNIDKLLFKVWDYAVCAEGSRRYEMTGEFLVFHTAAHLSYHFSHGGSGIRPFIDLWLLRHKTVFDESELDKMLSDCGIKKFYVECCHLAEVWLGDEEHTDVSKAMESFCLSGEVFGCFKNSYYSGRRGKSVFAYHLGRVFLSAKALKTKYPALEKRPYLNPVYQVKRWSEALIHKRKKIKSEISMNKKTDSEDIMNYDAFMRSVGL